MNEPPTKRILIIDDNQMIHGDFRKILGAQSQVGIALGRVERSLFGQIPAGAEQPEFEIDSAFQGQEGVERLRQALAEKRPYALAFVDIRMPPGWDGIETVTHLWREYPQLQVVLCTAFSDYSWQEIRAALGMSDRLVILKKPFENIEVLQLACALTEKWHLERLVAQNLEILEKLVQERTQDLQDTNAKLQSEMAERQRIEERLREAKALEMVGQLAAGVAHHFNNLLTVVQGNASLLLVDHPEEGEDRDSLRSILQAAERASRITSNLLAFSRQQLLRPIPMHLHKLIQRCLPRLTAVLGASIRLELAFAADLPLIHADPGMLEHLLMDFTANARDAMPGGGQLTFSTRVVEVCEEDRIGQPEANTGPHVLLTIHDTGCGMSQEVIARVFEPFFTTKDVGKGTGLGMATVYGVVKQHHGWINVKSVVNEGTTFEVFLPVFAKESAPASVFT